MAVLDLNIFLETATARDCFFALQPTNSCRLGPIARADGRSKVCCNILYETFRTKTNTRLGCFIALYPFEKPTLDFLNLWASKAGFQKPQVHWWLRNFGISTIFGNTQTSMTLYYCWLLSRCPLSPASQGNLQLISGLAFTFTIREWVPKFYAPLAIFLGWSLNKDYMVAKLSESRSGSHVHVPMVHFESIILVSQSLLADVSSVPVVLLVPSPFWF